ncbi:DNase I-like protein [Paraphaeosphaeria sporulosa]|uniref:DNase I-like protein n=1 Tax=Paraphaeosphaeria sporulosa TaxID=1460663 RepID=A0A177C5M1_9PLEO|nr:DNase I-like protein [Paraphaeosphaeria sporulosa]OAG02182.1 DNase I-like protein [Paraphaeosphaeria sporulosa]
MNCEISPPPAKRRKTSTNNVTPIKASISLPPTVPDADTMRIFSWNINGITPFLQKPITTYFNPTKPTSNANIPPASLRGFLKRHHWPAILFLQEVKIAAKDLKTQDAVQTAVNASLPAETSELGPGPRYEAHFTLPRDPHNARGSRGTGKVYGVCSIVRADVAKKLAATVRTVDWDTEGRVSVVELHSPSTKLALFNIYAINGTDAPYRDPATGVLRGTRHERKLAFHRFLMEECLEMEQDGWDVFLAGDMNVAPAAIDGFPRLRTFPHQHVVNRADFNARFLDTSKKKQGEGKVFEGIDVWRRMNEGVKRYTWFPRGRQWGSSCDRVDYIVVGESIWDRGMVRGAGILDSEAERGPSDHVPIWADIGLSGVDEEGNGKGAVLDGMRSYDLGA